MISVGIDPGLDGAVAAITYGSFDNWQAGVVDLFSVPIITEKKGKGIRRLYDEQGMVRLIREIHMVAVDGIRVTLEKAQAMPGQGVRSMFSIGEGFGLWKGILADRELPRQIIHPRTWQQRVCKDIPGDTKTKAILAAQRYFPKVDLRATERSKKPHTGRADATCMAIFGILSMAGKA